MSYHSVTTALALYGTPFFLRYPGLRFVVTTFKVPVRGWFPRPPAIFSQVATERPCKDGWAAGGGLPNTRRRVCVPASVSTLRVVSFSQANRTRPASLMMDGAP